MNTKPMSKLKFAWTKGGAVSWISFAALLLAAILVGVCLYTALFGSVLDMAFVNVADTLADGAFEDLEAELEKGENMEDEARKALEELEEEYDSLSKQEKKLVDKAEEMVDDLGELMDTPSLMVIRNLISKIGEDQELLEMLELAEDADAARQMQREAEDIRMVLDVIVIVIGACFGVAILFTFLAAMLRSTVLAVLGMLGSVALCAIFGGVIFVVAILVLDITAMVLHGALKKKYTKYLYPGYTG